MLTVTLAKTATLVALTAATSASYACSVCIAHAFGAGIHAVGAQTLHHGTTVIGVSYLSFSKSQAGETIGSEEKHDQQEIALDILHSINDQWMLRANLPYEIRKLSMTGEDPVTTRGFGDFTLGTTYQFKPKPKDKILLAGTADLKLATGSNGLTDATGSRLEEHSQLGTGSTDFSLGLIATMEDPGRGLWFAGLRARWNGTNSTGYHYGDTLFYNVGYSRSLSKSSALIMEFNGRIAGKDKVGANHHEEEEAPAHGGSEVDENSGGHFGYLSLSYRQDIGKEFGLVATYQLPVIRQLNGTQSETGLLTIGFFRKM